jgi:hypothetical protein
VRLAVAPLNRSPAGTSSPFFTTYPLVGHLGGALEQARVEVEDVARVRLAARRAAQQERELAVRDGLLGEIVVHESAWRPVSRKYSPIVTPVYGAMNWSGALSLAVAATTVVYSIAPNCSSLSTTWRDGRLLLADGDVDAEDALALLVDDRVERDGGLARLTVADDELALAAADRDHRVDGLDARLQRLLDRLARTMPGALISTRRRCGVSIGPLPSMGWPSALTTRPTAPRRRAPP